MTETDATRRPLQMPEKFIPYLEKYRIYKLFKDMVNELIINLPRDHLKFMKVFICKRIHCHKDPDKIMLLVSPELKIDTKKLVKELIKDMGCFVITRRCVMDRYEKDDNYEPGCISPYLLADVTKHLTLKDPVPQAGWLMFDHPCTTREARFMQQNGILPTVTLVLAPAPPTVPEAPNPLTPERGFFQQDFEGLKYAYKATLKEIFVEPTDDIDKLANKCFKGVMACAAGAQGPGQGFHVVGAPGTYRVLIIGPRGSGRKTQAMGVAKHFGLVFLNFDDLFNEALQRNDDVGKQLREYGVSHKLRVEIAKRKLLTKECIDHGWVMVGFPNSGPEFEQLDMMTTPPNRIIFLNATFDTCKKRSMSLGVDWCTGQAAPLGSNPRVLPYQEDIETNLHAELDFFFSETLAEMRAAAGLSAVEISAMDPLDHVQTKVLAAVIAAPTFNVEYCSPLRNVCGD